jgi:hypothetical protein
MQEERMERDDNYTMQEERMKRDDNGTKQDERMKRDDADYNGISTTMNTPQGTTPLLKTINSSYPTSPHLADGRRQIDTNTHTSLSPNSQSPNKGYPASSNSCTQDFCLRCIIYKHTHVTHKGKYNAYNHHVQSQTTFHINQLVTFHYLSYCSITYTDLKKYIH